VDKWKIFGLSAGLIILALGVLVPVLITVFPPRSGNDFYWEGHKEQQVADGFFPYIIMCKNCRSKNTVEIPIGSLHSTVSEKCWRCKIDLDLE